MADTNIIPLPRQTFLKMLENSVGTKLFNSLFVLFKDTNTTKDVLNDGEFSCAFFVSGILVLGGYLQRPNATVASLYKQCQTQNWTTVADQKDIEAGDIIFWEKTKFADGSENEHVGFAVSQEEAVSTNYIAKTVVRHPIWLAENGNERKITAIFRLPQ